MPGPATMNGMLIPSCQTVDFVQPSKVASGPHGVIERMFCVPLSASRNT